MAAYALLRGIDYIYEECPFAAGSTSIYYKEVLNRLESERPGSKLTFYLRFLEARAEGLFVEKERLEKLSLSVRPADLSARPVSFCPCWTRRTAADRLIAGPMARRPHDPVMPSPSPADSAPLLLGRQLWRAALAEGDGEALRHCKRCRWILLTTALHDLVLRSASGLQAGLLDRVMYRGRNSSIMGRLAHLPVAELPY
jgi:hypothetical protein